ncbi:hypothetical protein ACJX0J_010466 [Zea mays]
MEDIITIILSIRLIWYATLDYQILIIIRLIQLICYATSDLPRHIFLDSIDTNTQKYMCIEGCEKPDYQICDGRYHNHRILKLIRYTTSNYQIKSIWHTNRILILIIRLIWYATSDYQINMVYDIGLSNRSIGHVRR